MQKKHKEKLADYFSKMKGIKKTVFPVGVVIFKEKDRLAVLKEAGVKKILTLETENIHPDEVLTKMIKELKKDKPVILNIKGLLPAKIFNQLSMLALGNQIAVFLAGKKEMLVLKIKPEKAFVVLLLNDEDYNESILLDVPSSYCNLAS